MADLNKIFETSSTSWNECRDRDNWFYFVDDHLRFMPEFVASVGGEPVRLLIRKAKTNATTSYYIGDINNHPLLRYYVGPSAKYAGDIAKKLYEEHKLAHYNSFDD